MFILEKYIVQKPCVPLLLGNPFFQSKYSTYCSPNKEIKLMYVRRKECYLLTHQLIYSHVAVSTSVGLVGESKVRPSFLTIWFCLWSNIIFIFLMNRVFQHFWKHEIPHLFRTFWPNYQPFPTLSANSLLFKALKKWNLIPDFFKIFPTSGNPASSSRNKIDNSSKKVVHSTTNIDHQKSNLEC